MNLPYMAGTRAKTRRQIVSFGGINYSREAREGELAESTGLSCAQWPCLSQRAGRKTAGTYAAPTALYARGKLCVVDGTDLVYGDQTVGQVTPGPKQFAVINTKLVIFPDQVYYDTASGVFGSLGAKLEAVGGMASFTDNSLTFTAQGWKDQKGPERTLEGQTGSSSVAVYTGAAVDPATGALTMSGESAKTVSALSEGDLVQLGCGAGEYLAVKRAAMRWDGTWGVTGTPHSAAAVACPALETLFHAGDAVELSGCVDCAASNGSHIIRGVSGRTLRFDDSSFSQTGSETGAVCVERRVPELSCVCECDNRIWGAEGQTIYASALGDPTNFFVYDGLATDSYAAAVGTDGDFTGCVAYSSTVLFFKEDCVHRVLGSYPAQYEIYTYRIPGIQAGSERSLCIVNETLYYKGRAGVYAYAGGSPELISRCFGLRRFDCAAAGSDGERYYISMRGEGGGWELYTYDTRRCVWLREDATHAVDFASLDGTLYYLDGDSGRVVMTGQAENEDGPVEWSAELCPFDEVTHARKGYSKLYLRCGLDAGAWLKAEVSADGGPWQLAYTTHDERARTALVPILPTRCDCFRVRLSGKGECVVKSVVREFTVGSEV